ncbi:MAG: YciI family protein [Acidobacteriia bacterium]|nr:YciI family protein [Terriglobia bacterium]
MQYLLLIYHNEEQWENLPEPEKQKCYEGYRELRLDLEAKEKFKGANPLQPTSTATTVRLCNGKKLVTDGPFAETKEQLAGYILVEARDQDDASAIAARIPSAKMGSIEVRPVRTPPRLCEFEPAEKYSVRGPGW